ncbi:MAG: DNA replication and repair protein RecF [Candidatus Peribacteraceae bacterium]|nr:DNA replication and repair protein RecF [Candidatus Peribacteraceae bacterium]
MRINLLELEQFRSYGKFKHNFSSTDVNVLVGKNGVGKTNILESISILSLLKSCIGADENSMIQWENTYYRIRAEAISDSGEKCVLEVVSQNQPKVQKVCFLNDVKVSIDKIIGVIPSVVFLPQDLQLFTGSPANRRKFFDRLLSQVSPEYLKSLLRYGKILKQRNTLLRQIAEGKAKEEDLDVWDEHLSTGAAMLTAVRLELIGTLQLTLPEELRSLGEVEWKNIQLKYERKGNKTEVAALQMEYRELLKQYRKRDIILQATSVGPHREDWNISVDDRLIDTFASRGQQRTALLALLLLQVSYLELRCGEKPIILLDDVFSELDSHHQERLLNSLQGYQVLITTTYVPEGCDGFDVIEMKEMKDMKTIK